MFYAQPKGKPLGLFCGPDPIRDKLFAIGDPWGNSVIKEFALNPVSINSKGVLVLRIALENGYEEILKCTIIA